MLVDLAERDVDATVEELAARRSMRPRVLLQARVEGTVGAFAASGIADLVIVEPGETAATRDGRATRRRVGATSRSTESRSRSTPGSSVSWRSRLASRSRRWRVVSGACRRGLTMSSRRCSTSRPTRRRSSFCPTTRARSARVAAGPREDARFHLSYKCDGCLYNALCMRDAAEGEGLALVPFMTMRDRGALERHGVQRWGARCAQGPAGQGRLHVAAAGPRGSLSSSRRLNAEWPLGANLDLHVQRARAVARNWHPEVRVAWLDPRLRFRDASRSGGVPRTRAGVPRHAARLPRGSAVPRIGARGRPTGRAGGHRARSTGRRREEAEAELVVRWVTRLLDGDREVADGETALPPRLRL